MSEVFDIEKFSGNAQRLLETFEKANQYANDIDHAMTQLHEKINGSNIDETLSNYDQKLKEFQQNTQKMLDTLSGHPEEFQETTRRLLESAEQFGNSYKYLQSFRERAEKLTELLGTLGTLKNLEERLQKYEDELSKTSEMLEQIKKQELEIRNLPNVMKAMKESVADLQKQYIEAAADLRYQGEKAQEGVQSVKEYMQKAEELQTTLSEHVGFFKIGIYALIVMNTLMTVFVAIFLIKEFFF